LIPEIHQLETLRDNFRIYFIAERGDRHEKMIPSFGEKAKVSLDFCPEISEQIAPEIMGKKMFTG
jgi:hypothetical protein